MTIVGLLLLILVGALCGAIAELIVGWSPGGFLASTAIGFVGAGIGGWLARVLNLPSLLVVPIEGHRIEIFWTVMGAVLLLLVVSFVRRASYGRRLA